MEKKALFAISTLGLGHATRTLPIIKHYLKQDYIYLFHYSRAFALAIFKAKDVPKVFRLNKNYKKLIFIKSDYFRFSVNNMKCGRVAKSLGLKE